jgi:uncharacterized membrane protein
MAFCGNCGAWVHEGATTCPACGKPAAGTQAQQQSASGYTPPVVPGRPTQGDIRDAQDNKVMAILAYFGFLALIPWFGAPNSPFARFHARQGMKLFVIEIGYGILSFLLSLIKTTHTANIWGIAAYTYKATPGIILFLIWLIGIPIAILAIIGIINAAQGKFKAPPLLDKIPLF